MKDWIKVVVGALIVLAGFIGYQKYQEKKKAERIHNKREQIHRKMENDREKIRKEMDESRQKLNRTIEEYNSTVNRL